MPSERCAFNVFVLGSSGGPADCANSAYLFKSAQTAWQKDCLLGIDAGTLVDGLQTVVERSRRYFPAVIPEINAVAPEPDPDSLAVADNSATVLNKCQCDELSPELDPLDSAAPANTRPVLGFAKSSASRASPDHSLSPRCVPSGGDHLIALCKCSKPAEKSSDTGHTRNADRNSVSLPVDREPPFTRISSPIRKSVDSGVPFFRRKSNVFGGYSLAFRNTGGVKSRSASIYGIPNVVTPKHDNKAVAWAIVHEYVSEICLTHQHMDHVNGLLINSPGLSAEKPKQITGFAHVLDAVVNHLFNGVIWPNLTNEGGASYLTLNRVVEKVEVATKAANLLITPYSIRHGACKSTAFFVRDVLSDSSILMFGDVEPDEISGADDNLRVWEKAAEIFTKGKLKAVFIECSFPSNHSPAALFGHLSPVFVVDELLVLKRLVAEYDSSLSLTGLKVFITHIKENVSPPTDFRLIVLEQIRSQAKLADLQCEFLAPVSGDVYVL